MQTPYMVMLGALIISAVISFVTGRLLWGFLLPTLGAGLFVSVGAIRDPGWFVGLFFMAAIPYSVISFFGASIGALLSPYRKSKDKTTSPDYPR